MELKPCPFCGSEAKPMERHNPLSKWRWSVDCTSSRCAMSGPVEATQADAVTEWNSRCAAKEANDRFTEENNEYHISQLP